MAFERLVRAGLAYDAGHHSDALTIAALVYVFVYDHGRSAVSLLSLVQRKNSIAFRDTATPINPRNMLTEHPLAMIEATTRSEGSHFLYKPVLNELIDIVGDNEVRFSAWWEATVLRDPKRHEFSRKNLTFFFRNKLGGAHVSEGYDQIEQIASVAFADLAQSDAGGWLLSSGDRTLRPEYGVQFATVRQIGWELEQTLRRHCRDFITDTQGLAPSLPKMVHVTDRGLGK